MSLQSFIQKLEENDELIKVKTPVSTNLEITELTDRMSKQQNGGKALFFENTDRDYPVITNMLGSEKRMAWALNAETIDEAEGRITALVEMMMSKKKGIKEKLASALDLWKVSRCFPKKSAKIFGENANYKELRSLFDIPVLQCWKHDGGQFITLPMVITNNIDTDVRNVGMYRVQLSEDKKCWVHWQKHKTGQLHYEKYQKAGKKMPVAIAIGGDPAYTYASTAPLPPEINEFMFAGVLRKKAVKLQKCKTVDLEVPQDCDFVIEGYVDTSKEMTMEGPFGDHTGFYSLPDLYPMLEVTRIVARKDAIYPATIVGVPPQEDAYIALATEKLFSAPIKKVIQPDLCEMHLPSVGIAHNLALITMESRYPGHAQQCMTSLWGAGQMSFTKVMIVSNNRNPKNYEKFARFCLANFEPKEDCLFIKGPADVLDHSSRQFAYGGKMGLDCTGDKEPIENWKNYIHFAIVPKGNKKSYEKFCENFVKNKENKKIKIVLTIDKTTSITDYYTTLWMILNNIDPAEDCFVLENTLFVDGSKKSKEEDGFTRDWPNVVTMDKATIEKVDTKWEEYGIGDFITSPSLSLLPLVETDSAFYFKQSN